MKLKYYIAVLTALLASGTQSQAAVKLPSMFSDGMVLQSNSKIKIWGKANPHETVHLRFKDQAVTCSADSQGNWHASIGPLRPTADANFSIQGQNSIVLKHVAVGDVYNCSGQSNMMLSLKNSDIKEQHLAGTKKSFIHIFQFPGKESSTDVFDPGGSWLIENDNNTKDLPAIPFALARAISAKREIPVGIIVTARDGAPIESFMSEEALKRITLPQALLSPPHKPSSNFKTRLYPFLDYGTSGFIWYQGESNLNSAAAYKKYFPEFVTDIRTRMHAEALPFVFVQLPNFGYKLQDNPPVDSYWADVREAQTSACRLKNVKMVVTFDTAKEDADQLHPGEKKVIVERLAEAILDRDGENSGKYSPQPASGRIENDAFLVKFQNSRITDARKEKTVHGFQIAGSDRKFHWADATVESDGIKITSDDVADPVAVRYAWADNPDGDLFLDGMPVAPFRTDRWVTRPKLNPAAAAHHLSSKP